MNVITRFAPSPTGKLHIGNVRTAVINWLYTLQYGGKFYLRIDDTDIERSKEEYREALLRDLKWLGLEWDLSFSQINRISIYRNFAEQLIKAGRVYPCYETPEELEKKRQKLLTNGKPPIYDRSSLRLSEKQIQEYESAGRKPHYRFLLENNPITWPDMVKGEIKFQGGKLSDPVIIRNDGSFTYLLCSTIDDIEYKISHIIRGEDHVTNTAIQIQMFEALGGKVPEFGHVNLLKSLEGKISKRIGGFTIEDLRQEGVLPMTINSYLAFLGTSKPISGYKNIPNLVKDFSISHFTSHSAIYQPDDLYRLNHKLISTLEYNDIKDHFKELGIVGVNNNIWLAIRDNILTLEGAKDWVSIITKSPEYDDSLDWDFLHKAATLLPQEITEDTWKDWTNKVSKETGAKGKQLYVPLRLAITGKDQGPELKLLLPLIGSAELVKRLTLNQG